MLSTTRKDQHKGLPLLLIILCFSLSSSCAVNMMSDYDSKTDERIESFSHTFNDLLYQLEEQNGKQPECGYENHADAYRNLKVQLQTMDMHEQAKPKNTQTQQQVTALQQRLNLFITDHKRVCPPVGAVMVAQKQVNQMLGHILKLERTKHRSK